MITREEITRHLREFEESHSVESWRIHDWRAWPALRVLTSRFLRFSSPPAPSPLQRLKAGLTAPFRRSRKRREEFALLDEIDKINRREGLPPDAPNRDVVILTDSNRVQMKGDAYYHYLVDPLVEKFEKRGARTLVWETHHPRTPRHIPHSYCQAALKRKRDRFRDQVRTPDEAPRWFSEYSEFVSTLVGRKIEWAEVAPELRYVQVTSLVFEKWLRRAGASLLVVDCWYGPRGLAANIAAARLSITTMDLQHGLQGAGHFGYSGWTRAPRKAYEAMPDLFWFWGREDARNFVDNNGTGFESGRKLVGGHLWINKWREGGDPDLERECGRARELRRDAQRAVLVTLQKGFPFKDHLYPLIRNSPREWLWLVRLHRAMLGQMEEIERELSELDHPRVNVRQATELPLYALVKASDCHMTGCSTCAVEAAAFGVPSVLTHPTGREAYERYIDESVMFYAPAREGDIQSAITHAFEVAPDSCRKAVEPVFAPPEATEEALSELMLRSGVEGTPPPSEETTHE